MAFCQVVALLLVLAISTSCDTKWVSASGKDEPSCGDVAKPCHSLEYVAEQIAAANDSGPVKIAVNTTFILSHKVTFEGIHHLTLEGTGITTILCSDGSGLIFQSVTDLEITVLSLTSCGVEGPRGLTAAIHIQECTNVTMQNVNISNSKGPALMFFDTVGEVLLSQLLVRDNGNFPQENYSNGVHVQLTQCIKEGSSANYRIDTCDFVNNSAYVRGSDSQLYYKGRGGGLGFNFYSNSCLNTIFITNTTFTQNQARWGGGLHLHFHGSPHENSVTVRGSVFVANKARGAGGAAMGYSSTESNQPPLNLNSISFQNTTFYRNWAYVGGGATVFAKHSTSMPRAGEMVVFNNCSWIENSGTFSPAVDISPYNYDTLSHGFLPVPVFTNCYFSSNVVQQNGREDSTRNAAGAFLITQFTVQFEGHLSFVNHSYTPLQLVSGAAKFEAGSNVLFLNNTGIQGGAIAMYGFSSLHVRDNSIFSFINNTARDVGGAIYYQSLDQHDFVSSHTCFIQYDGNNKEVNLRNITMRLSGNTASQTGESIFATSLYPCYYQYFDNISEHSYVEVFNRIVNLTFDDLNNSSLGTEGRRFDYQWNGNVIPGKLYKLPIRIEDELGNNVSTLLRLDTSVDSKVNADRTYTANRYLRLFGNPGDNGSLQLFSVGFREIAISIDITFLYCPPGYFYNIDGKHPKGSCECAAYYQDHAYPGIGHCNSTLFRAYIERGYWAGYPNAEPITPEGLHTAPCRLGFCSYEFESEGPLYLLPNVSSRKVLDDWMCGQYRTGILCGRCARGLSVYYHSQQYRCASSKNCGLGVLFYILSEIFPLTVLFTTVVVFDIRFTSGTLNGFVFFSQVLDTLSIDANGAIKFPRGVEELSIGYSVLYGLLNFDFFSIESLSFCLWEGATVLDIVAFKYVTVAFALILVVSLVTIMRWCNCQCLCRIKRKISTKDSVIHGLTAFLVMCYTQCTQVSFQILTAVRLTGKGGHSDSQVTYYGGIPYMGTEHLSYVIPALLCVTTIVAIPPIVLLVFPLYNHVLVWFGLTENKKCNWLSRFLLVNKLKPVLDSFQGCFKDNFRFFAGLYFVYRVAIMAAYTFSTSALQFYFIIEVLLVFMLWLQATAQPYISRLHNVVDSFMFGSLTLINAFTMYNYYFRLATPDIKVDAVFWIQLVLIYLPLILVAIFIIGRVARMLPRRHTTESPPEASVNFSLDSVDSFIDHDRLPYQEFDMFQLTREASPPDTRPDFGF